MKYLLLFSVILFSMASSAQDCSIELILQTPGRFKTSPPYKSENISALDLAKQKKVVATITNMIKSKYAPMGLEAFYHENHGSDSRNMPVNEYGFSMSLPGFYCDGNSIKTAGETSTSFYITANNGNAEIYQLLNNEEETSGIGFQFIKDMPVLKDGYWYFKEKDVNLGFGIKGKEHQWLVTYDGKLPYAYVTKKEFLEVQKKLVANAMDGLAEHDKDVLKNNEITKGFKEKEYKSEPEKLKKYMKMEYLEIKVRYEKSLSDNEKDYKPAFDKIEQQLKMPAGELNQQAIVKLDPLGSHLAYLFTDDSDPFGQVLIKPNPAYFKKLPRSSPQFFGISLTGCHTEPIAAKFMTDIMKAVDFAALKNMLGK